MDFATIEKEAMLLPDVERTLLADRLLESFSHVSHSSKMAWTVEAESRLSAFSGGMIQAVDGPTAFSELRARFSRSVIDS